MQITNIIFGILNITCGIIFLLIGIPLAIKKVPMNRVFGFRFEKSFVSADHWYSINCYGGKQLIHWSVMLILIGVLYFIFPIQELEYPMINVFLAVLPMMICSTAAILKTLLFSRQIE